MCLPWPDPLSGKKELATTCALVWGKPYESSRAVSKEKSHRMVHLQHLKPLSATLSSWVMSWQSMLGMWAEEVAFLPGVQGLPATTAPSTELWMGEDNSPKVSSYTDKVEEQKIWANRMVMDSSSILYPCTSNLASFHSIHQPALTSILIYMVLCNKKPIIWARSPMWGQSAAFTGELCCIKG